MQSFLYEKQLIIQTIPCCKNTTLAYEYLVDLDSESTILKTVDSLLFPSQTDMKNWAIFASAISLNFLIPKLFPKTSQTTP